MKRDNFVLCGVIKVNDSYSELYCDPEVGEICFEHEDTGTTYLIGEVSVTDPIRMPSIEKLIPMVEAAGLIGAIFTQSKAIAIISDYCAEDRMLGKLGISTDSTYAIDTNIEAEIED